MTCPYCEYVYCPQCQLRFGTDLCTEPRGMHCDEHKDQQPCTCLPFEDESHWYIENMEAAS